MQNTLLIPPTDSRLNDTAHEVPAKGVQSQQVQAIIDRMLELAAGKGHSNQDTRQMVGLAAVQLGIPKRIISIDLTADGSLKKQHLQVIINPRITDRSDKFVQGREGCWSCGNICGVVERSHAVSLEGLSRDGKHIQFDLVGFVARIAQHEVDHLDGIRFPERIPTSKPERLHWVEPSQFSEYRERWKHWPVLCPRKTWEEMRNGVIDDGYRSVASN